MRSYRATALLRLAVKDVVETRLGATLIAESLEEAQRIDNAPPGVGVDPDEPLVFRRNLVRIAVPFEEALVEVVGLLDEWQFEVQARVHNRCADRVAELGDDDLLRLTDDVRR